MDKSWNQNESLSLHSFPKTSGLIVKSHCYFKVLAMCIWRSHTWSPTSSSRHPSILKSSYSMSGLVENRCWYKKDMLVLLSTLLSRFLCFVLNQNVTICYDSDPWRPSCRVLCSRSLDKQLPKICPIGSHWDLPRGKHSQSSLQK